MTRLEQLSEANRKAALLLEWLQHQLTAGLPALEKAREQLAGSENSPSLAPLARPMVAALDEMVKYREELSRTLESIANGLRV